MVKEHSLILNGLFFIVGLIFYLLEVLVPERQINRKIEFKKDILAFFVLIFSGLIISAPLITFFNNYSLPHHDLFKDLNPIVKVLLATLVLDYLNYWIHFFMHKYNWYWKAHIFHHKVEQLYWFSGLRASFTHYASFIISRSVVGILLFHLNSFELLIYLVFGYTTNFYQHTNARVGHRWIEWILVTPRIHRLHHSTQGRRMKNLGTIFSFWDRLHGTWLDPEQYNKEYELGVKPNDKAINLKELVGI